MSAPRYPRGSEWRKWDLHLHAPGTKLGDQYTPKDGQPDLEQFCQIVHDSDVAVVAIADYFSFVSYFSVVETYRRLYPDDGKLLLPNLELRLPVAVNRADQEVNLHLIFQPSLTRDEASKFLSRLKTEGTTGSTRTHVTCADLRTRQQFEGATVSIASIEEAIKETFGSHAMHRTERPQRLLVVASAKGDGIRAGGSGIQRKKLLSDEIDKYADAIYANTGSRDYFLSTDRLESDDVIAPKPVFDGCDAHSFDQLKSGLGQQVSTDGCRRNVTWIKADPTYPGLLQTLIEPADRVAMQAAKPDQKEPYKLISRVKFSGTNDFPAEVLFNPNLNAIIGSRSSGKSALLAFIAHAVNPTETARLQMEAAGLHDAKEAGPAAGFTWDDVSEVTCEVEWESGEGTSGKVIYIPQNSLYTLSKQPEEITKKIAPALFRTYPAIKTAYDSAMSTIAAANTEIKNAIDEWFGLADRVDERSQEIKDLGDKTAITAERDRLQDEINRIKAATQLTDEEVTKYQDVAAQLDDKKARLKEIAGGLDQLSSYVSLPEGTDIAVILPRKVQATVTVRPSTVEIPDAVSARIDEIKAEAAKNLVATVEKTLVDAVTTLDTERSSLRSEIASIKGNNAELITKHEANEELSGLVSNHKKQIASLEDIAKRERSRDKLIRDQEAVAAKVVKGITDRDEALSVLEKAFNVGERILIDLKFGIEVDVPTGVAEHASVGFNQRSVNAYVKHKGDSVSYEDAQSDPTKFLNSLRTNRVALNKNYEPNAVAADVLTVTKEIRFFAELDSDRIGGFSSSSMTPGKQALFALTLILNESQEPWPLLIDQPEDDLDSRSIYDTIVPYLMERKKERQIIMASHNANLVIGADSEEIIVTNRHGADRPNKDSRTFEYLTGSLEHSQDRDNASPTILGRSGIREHACEILDGGEEAFRKRREKYKI
jgi:ABC-type cobalamin/Fe3+-siderophores transport system ATPase subunit